MSLEVRLGFIVHRLSRFQSLVQVRKKERNTSKKERRKEIPVRKKERKKYQ